MKGILKAVYNRDFISQIISYFFVGLVAALVEWLAFWVLNERIHFNIYKSTGTAFVLATFTNWIIARNTTFKRKVKLTTGHIDIIAVFFVSGIGLFFNLLMMRLLVGELELYPLAAKIISTGVVFFWNFLSRKFLIYR